MSNIEEISKISKRQFIKRILSAILIFQYSNPLKSNTGQKRSAHDIPKLDLFNLSDERRKFSFKNRKIIMNNDGNDLYINNESEKSNPKVFISRRFSKLQGTQVGAVSYCTGIFNSYTHLSMLSESRLFDAAGRELLTKYLYEKGTDSLNEAIKFCRANNLDIFWSFRFNDTHDSQPGMQLTAWKAAHMKSLLGKPGEQFSLGGNAWAALNYSRRDVMDHVFNIIKDVVSRYHIDGIEIDFFRHLYVFPETQRGLTASDRNRKKLTHLIQRIRALLDEQSIINQKPMLLLVRLPDSLQYCYDLGLDLRNWLEHHYVDIVIAGGYFKLEPWTYIVSIGRKYNIPIYACLTPRRIHQGGTPGQASDLPKWRGEAYNAWKAGVNGIYTFNRFQLRDPIFKEIGDLNILEKLFRDDRESYFCDTCWYNPQRWLKDGDKYLKINQK